MIDTDIDNLNHDRGPMFIGYNRLTVKEKRRILEACIELMSRKDKTIAANDSGFKVEFSIK